MSERASQKPNRFGIFTFYRLDNRVLELGDDERRELKREFVEAASRSGDEMRFYSTAGLRPETDFLIYHQGKDLKIMQSRASLIRRCRLHLFLDTPYLYLCTKRVSEYTSPEGGSEVALESGMGEYLFVYPFIKTREWYLMSVEERQRIMNEHIQTGRKHPGVRINTAYSFGIGDQDFLLSFDCNDPFDFQSLVMELRATEASRYTVRDTPMFVCVRSELREILDSLF